GRSPVTGQFVIDSGALGTATLARPFVDSNNLLTGSPRLHSFTSLGVGGESDDLIGRLQELRIGRFALRDPVAVFSRAKSGALSHADRAGIVAGEILSRFKVIFDYWRRRIILEPNSHLDEPFTADASGVRIVVEGPGYNVYRIGKVTDDSAAAEAG